MILLGYGPGRRPVGRSRSFAGMVGATGAALTVRASRALLGTAVGPADPRWTRTNHRGEPVSLLAGPAAGLGLLAGSALTALTAPDAGPATAACRPARGAAAALVAVTGGAVLGVVDDVSEDPRSRRKGLRGHLGALATGEVTTGGLKVLGIGATSLLAAALATPRPSAATAGPLRPARLARAVDVWGSGALIAGTANLVNLLDLRPGRALKAAALVAVPLLRTAAAPLAGVALGAVAAAAGPDLREEDMLGDGGANALGALLGTAVVVGAPRATRWAVLAAVVALTLASERVSFTAVIARTPVLRELDAWGRRA